MIYSRDTFPILEKIDERAVKKVMVSLEIAIIHRNKHNVKYCFNLWKNSLGRFKASKALEKSEKKGKEMESFSFRVIINTTPCQFTNSKTRTGIKYITNLVASTGLNGEQGVHHITLIITNKCLLDGHQWLIRLSDNNDGINLNVSILSSDAKSKYRSCDELKGKMLSVTKADQLDDVIIMCNHNKRIEDVKDLLTTINNERLNLSEIGIKKIKFTLMFDEVDIPENMNHALQVMSMGMKVNCIDSIHLITATPFEKFWKKLKKVGITELDNIRHLIGEIDPPEQLIEDYRKLNDHTIFESEEKNNVVDKSKNVYKNIKNNAIMKTIKKRNKKEKEDKLVDTPLITDPNRANGFRPLRIFAPGVRSRKTHKEISEYFHNEGFIAITFNSDKKNTIRYPSEIRHPCHYIDPETNNCIKVEHPNRECESIEEFNMRVGLLRKGKKSNVNMYDTLTLMELLYKDINIMITGFICIERGITFQTKTKYGQFGFTDLILPTVIDCLASLIQILGRANGHKNFVNSHNIHMTQNLYDEVSKQLEYQINIIKSNYEKITAAHCRDKTQREKEEPFMTVPIRIELSGDDNDNYDYYAEKTGAKCPKFKRKSAIIEKVNKELKRLDSEFDIKYYNEALCSEPTDSTSGYKKNITPIINAVERNEKYVTLHKNKKFDYHNYYSVYFDSINKQMFVMLWNGEKRKELEEDE